MENEWDDIDFMGGLVPEGENEVMRFIKELNDLADSIDCGEVSHLLKGIINNEIDYMPVFESELRDFPLYTSIYNTRDRIYPPEAYE